MEKFYSRKIVINKEQNLLRLDQALARLSNFTRSQIKILILNENVKKEGTTVKDASYKVKEGEEYFLTLVIPREEKYISEDIPLDIIFEDNDIIIINKRAGMVTHPAPGNETGTLVNALLSHTGRKLSTINEKNRPGIVHRLDKETSGLIVIAKNNNSHNNLSEQFKNNHIIKKYKAIVWGIPNNQIIEGFIERHKINRKKMTLNNNKGKFSRTTIKQIKTFKIASLIECNLLTGRTHQIRVHMTSINCPLIGDKLYGKSKINQFGKNKETFNNFLILKNFSRQALHSYFLRFKHPTTNNYIEFKTDLPKDMKNLLELIAKY